MNRYIYSVVVYVDFIAEINKTRICKGYVCADSEAEAIEKLNKYYGEDNIECWSLKFDNDSCVIELSDKNVDEDTDSIYNWKGPALNDFC